MHIIQENENKKKVESRIPIAKNIVEFDAEV